MKPIPSKKSRRAEPLSTVSPRAAGIDVGAQFHVVVATARDVEHAPGRKTDVNDAQWLRQLHA